MTDKLCKRCGRHMMETELEYFGEYCATCASADEAVNHPAHYKGKYECAEVMKDIMPNDFRGFLKGNVFKYIWRAGKKDSELQDLKKAQWYLNALVAYMEERNET